VEKKEEGGEASWTSGGVGIGQQHGRGGDGRNGINAIARRGSNEVILMYECGRARRGDRVGIRPNRLGPLGQTQQAIWSNIFPFLLYFLFYKILSFTN
jgi:hypothetical protein